jgi:hypothetical protein
MSNSTQEKNSKTERKENSKKKLLTQHNIFIIKNKLVNDLTHAIQLVKYFIFGDFSKEMS